MMDRLSGTLLWAAILAAIVAVFVLTLAEGRQVYVVGCSATVLPECAGARR